MLALPAALFEHAESHPDYPCLFRPDGWDWRWLSFADCAGRVRAYADELRRLHSREEGGRSGTRRVSFAYGPGVEELLFDLGVQAASFEAAPSRVLQKGEGEGLRRIPLPESIEAYWQPGPEASSSEGGCVVRLPGRGSALWRPEDLTARARRLGEALEGSLGKSGGSKVAGRPFGETEVLIASGPLDDPGERLLTAWGWLQGAAIVALPHESPAPGSDPPLLAPASVMEPDQGWVASAAWLRPTVFYGGAPEIDALAALIRSSGSSVLDVLSKRIRGRAARRLPWDRLRAVVRRGVREPAPETEDLWAGSGVVSVVLSEVLEGV